MSVPDADAQVEEGDFEVDDDSSDQEIETEVAQVAQIMLAEQGLQQGLLAVMNCSAENLHDTVEAMLPGAFIIESLLGLFRYGEERASKRPRMEAMKSSQVGLPWAVVLVRLAPLARVPTSNVLWSQRVARMETLVFRTAAVWVDVAAELLPTDKNGSDLGPGIWTSMLVAVDALLAQRDGQNSNAKWWKEKAWWKEQGRQQGR